MGQNCLQRLSADDTNPHYKERINERLYAHIYATSSRYLWAGLKNCYQPNSRNLSEGNFPSFSFRLLSFFFQKIPFQKYFKK